MMYFSYIFMNISLKNRHIFARLHDKYKCKRFVPTGIFTIFGRISINYLAILAETSNTVA
ncbi:hypothetical protein GCM10027291_24260 [Telluribacter humicola]